jgi:hypothetical protein
MAYELSLAQVFLPKPLICAHLLGPAAVEIEGGSFSARRSGRQYPSIRRVHAAMWIAGHQPSGLMQSPTQQSEAGWRGLCHVE